MTSLVSRLAQEVVVSEDDMYAGYPERLAALEQAVADALRAALREAVTVARSQRYSSRYQADPDTCERIAAEIEALAE